MKMRLFILIGTLLPCLFGFVSCRETEVKQNANANVPSNNSVNKPVNTNSNSTQTSIPTYGYEVVKTYPHDENAFTEGLFFYDGWLYESVGQEGKSSLRKVEPATGIVKQQIKLSKDVFGEGTTLLDNKIYQLTWQTGKCYVYDAKTFEKLKEFDYNGEGWGMTNDGTNLIMTDGSHQIRFREPETFKVVRTINVFREDGKPQLNLNELELIKGELWANIWHSEDKEILGKPNHIARIDPQNGKLLGWLNLDGISPEDVKRDRENTLNGIAYDEANDRIFVTGKNWRKIFEIRVK